MLRKRMTRRFGFLCVWLAAWLAGGPLTRADIFRWDTGELIPGTEGITPGPGVELNDFQLEYASLSHDDLTAANFQSSNLTSASLYSSRLTDANFAGAIVKGANLANTGITKEQLYSTVSYQRQDLQGIKLSGGFDFLGGDLTGWDLSGQDLTNAGITHATLTDANFAGANLAGANFAFSTLTDADFSGAIVAGALYVGFTKEQLYSTASYQQGNLAGIVFSSIFPQTGGTGGGFVKLIGWDLSGQDLTNASIAGSTLIGANLRAANLTNANFVLSTLTDANFAGANLKNASLEGAALMGASLNGADMRGATGLIDLTGAVITNAIHPDGSVMELNLSSADEFVVRDDDGVADPPPPLPFHSAPLTPRAPIAITVQDHFTMSGGGVLRMVFEADPWDSLISFEAGMPVELGGTLELAFADDAAVASQVGRTLHIFDWTGVTPTGAFAVASPYQWDVSQLYTTGEVTLLAVPEPSGATLLLLVGLPLLTTRRR